MQAPPLALFSQCLLRGAFPATAFLDMEQELLQVIGLGKPETLSEAFVRSSCGVDCTHVRLQGSPNGLACLSGAD
jgi:hypothetical protein